MVEGGTADQLGADISFFSNGTDPDDASCYIMVELTAALAAGAGKADFDYERTRSCL